MKNSLETKLGVFVALTVIVAVLIIETLGSADIFSRGYRVSAMFDNSKDLKVGDRVKMAGVEIGRVEKIVLGDNKVSVTMKMKSDAAVKTDSKATIQFTGLMGQNYVAVSFGAPGSPQVEEGFVLTTAEQADLSVIMDKLDKAATGIANLGSSFTGDKIDNLVGPLTDFIKQNSGPLTATIANVKNVTSQIAAGQGTVGKLIYEDALYASALTTVSNLQDTSTSAKEMISSAKVVMADVTAGKGTIGKLLTDETLYRATTSSMTNLNSILFKINDGQGTVGKLVNEKEFLDNAKLSLQKLDKAADSLEDTGPLSVIGIMANQFGL
jgi:phospholipid/cholesterol/gamma-HCH transport system substrate-binding protein